MRLARPALLCAALAAGIAASLSLPADAAAKHWRGHPRRGVVYNPLFRPFRPPVVRTTVPRIAPIPFGPYAPSGPLPSGPYPPTAPLPLPGGMSLEIDPPSGTVSVPSRLDRWRDVGLALRACWAPPAPPADGTGEPREVTLRLGFSRAGRVLGSPRVTYSRPAATTETQKAFTAAALAALARCAPLPFTAGLGSAIAGVPFSIRFTDGRTPSTDKDHS